MADKQFDLEAGMWGVLDAYGFPVVEITRVTEQCFWSKGGRFRGEREVRAYLEKLVCWSPDRAAAEKASSRMTSAEAERDRRISSARIWYANERKKIATRLATLEAGGVL